MTEAELIRELNTLGIDDRSHRVLALLPLVQVAWADGLVQDEERELILAIARDKYALESEGQLLLSDWLLYPPSAWYLDKGRRLLREVALRGVDLGPDSIRDVLTLATQVAKVAGGLFGFGAVHPNEQEALREIAAVLEVIDREPSWAELADLDEHDEDTSDTPTDALDAEQMARLLARAKGESSREERPSPIAVLVEVDSGGQEHAGSGPFSVGRTRDNALMLQADGKVSRHHCVIVQEEGRWYVQDLDSQNGTWVNGERVKRRRLFGGEELLIGASRVGFRVET